MHCKQSEVKEAKHHLTVVEMSSEKGKIMTAEMTMLYICWRTWHSWTAQLRCLAVSQSAICNFRTGYCSCTVSKLIRADYE